MINLNDTTDLLTRLPIMIAHRGGVVTTGAPENSQQAIEFAAQQGYDLVELDICCAADHTPVLFHGRGPFGSLMVDCGIAGNVSDFPSSELTQFTYRGTNQTILLLEQALDLCVSLDLGVMLDMKTFNDDPLPADYLDRVAKLFVERHFEEAIMTLSMRPEVREALPASTLWPIRERNLADLLANQDNLKGYFWFDDPASATNDEIWEVHERGALTIACINNFRYPAHSFNQLEEIDINRMKQCDVDGYQIDSQYGRFFEKLKL